MIRQDRFLLAILGGISLLVLLALLLALLGLIAGGAGGGGGGAGKVATAAYDTPLSGEIDVLRVDDGEALYRACRTEEHHHHLVCRVCGRTVEVAGPAVESWADVTASEHGFRDVRHTVEIIGTCSAC